MKKEKVSEVVEELQQTFPKILYYVGEKGKVMKTRIVFSKVMHSDREILLFFKVFTSRRILRIIPQVMNIMIAIDSEGIRIYGLKQHPLRNEIEEILRVTAEHVKQRVMSA